jgi:hypothetical protein
MITEKQIGDYLTQWLSHGESVLPVVMITEKQIGDYLTQWDTTTSSNIRMNVSDSPKVGSCHQR